MALVHHFLISLLFATELSGADEGRWKLQPIYLLFFKYPRGLGQSGSIKRGATAPLHLCSFLYFRRTTKGERDYIGYRKIL